MKVKVALQTHGKAQMRKGYYPDCRLEGGERVFSFIAAGLQTFQMGNL